MVRFSTLLRVMAFALMCAPVMAEDLVDVKARDLTLSVPQSWKQQPPANSLRLAQFIIPAAEGDKEEPELVVSGPFGGSVPPKRSALG